VLSYTALLGAAKIALSQLFSFIFAKIHKAGFIPSPHKIKQHLALRSWPLPFSLTYQFKLAHKPKNVRCRAINGASALLRFNYLQRLKRLLSSNVLNASQIPCLNEKQ